MYLGYFTPYMKAPREEDARALFCNRTLNLRAIRAVGYDMDYTLVHYKAEGFEEQAYLRLKERFLAAGWPIQHLKFDPSLVSRGLIVDLELGNLVKANRFGFVKKAVHGTRALDFEEQRKAYSRVIVDLSEPRWIFLNTLFSISEGCMYAQLVDLLDERRAPEVFGYAALYHQVKRLLDAAHMEGHLKAEILSKPEKYVELDPEVPLTLLDQKHAGKKLLMITNSEWSYSVSMMSYAFDRFLPKGQGWRSLFDLVIVGARKPDFFTKGSPFFEVVTPEGLLSPVVGSLREGGAYLGGSARVLEKHLGLSGDEILYVGDHMFGDVHVTKNVLRWRTALVLRELEEEVRSVVRGQVIEERIQTLMIEKEKYEGEACQIRLELQRRRVGYGPAERPLAGESEAKLQTRNQALRAKVEKIDEELGPLVQKSGELNDSQWGLLMRAGNDKSHLARQVERYADVYTSRVSNLGLATPFVYLRSPRGSLPHDP